MAKVVYQRYFELSLCSAITHSLIKVFQNILEKAHKAPLTAKTCLGDNGACSEKVTAFNVQTAMYNALQGHPDFPQIFAGLKLADSEPHDASFFAPQEIPDVSYVWSVPISCSDDRTQTPSFLLTILTIFHRRE